MKIRWNTFDDNPIRGSGWSQSQLRKHIFPFVFPNSQKAVICTLNSTYPHISRYNLTPQKEKFFNTIIFLIKLFQFVIIWITEVKTVQVEGHRTKKIGVTNSYLIDMELETYFRNFPGNFGYFPGIPVSREMKSSGKSSALI